MKNAKKQAEGYEEESSEAESIHIDYDKLYALLLDRGNYPILTLD